MKGKRKMEKSKVYFTKEITPENVVKMFKKLEKELPGKVAVKVHSGEEGNQNYLRPEFMKKIMNGLNILMLILWMQKVQILYWKFQMVK